MRLGLAAAVLLLGLGCAPQGSAQRTEFPKPDRPVAGIVSPRWSADADRDRVNESGQIARALDLKAGMSVADIGAGSGYHTFRLAPVVGPTGRVYAEDIMPTYLDALTADVEKRGVKNIVVVRGEADDPKLPAGQIDAAIMVHMYHEIEQPFALLYHLVPAFRPGGKLAIVDQIAPTNAHGTPPALLNCELAAVGYRQLSLIRLKDDEAYLAIFEPPTLAARPRPSQIHACKG
jgi:ubiquinone/menaquinone biosynthesis C-methylase UbiE